LTRARVYSKFPFYSSIDMRFLKFLFSIIDINLLLISKLLNAYNRPGIFFPRELVVIRSSMTCNLAEFGANFYDFQLLYLSLLFLNLPHLIEKIRKLVVNQQSWLQVLMLKRNTYFCASAGLCFVYISGGPYFLKIDYIFLKSLLRMLIR